MRCITFLKQIEQGLFRANLPRTAWALHLLGVLRFFAFKDFLSFSFVETSWIFCLSGLLKVSRLLGLLWLFVCLSAVCCLSLFPSLCRSVSFFPNRGLPQRVLILVQREGYTETHTHTHKARSYIMAARPPIAIALWFSLGFFHNIKKHKLHTQGQKNATVKQRV